MKNKYKTTNSIVAFIDVLGSSEAIKNDADKSLQMMHDAYTEAVMLFQSLFEDNERVAPEVKIFSDNIVVSVSREGESGHGAFCAIAMISAMIQVQFLKHGLLTRGAIASGSYFVDDMMVWGIALVKAHTLESSIAVYPRIVVDPELIADLDLANPNSKFTKTQEWIEQDTDGIFMIDYLNKYLRNKDVLILSLMSLADLKVVEYCSTNNVKVCQKWLWFLNYIQGKITRDEKQDQ